MALLNATLANANHILCGPKGGGPAEYHPPCPQPEPQESSENKTYQYVLIGLGCAVGLGVTICCVCCCVSSCLRGNSNALGSAARGVGRGEDQTTLEQIITEQLSQLKPPELEEIQVTVNAMRQQARSHQVDSLPGVIHDASDKTLSSTGRVLSLPEMDIDKIEVRLQAGAGMPNSTAPQPPPGGLTVPNNTVSSDVANHRPIASRR